MIDLKSLTEQELERLAREDRSLRDAINKELIRREPDAPKPNNACGPNHKQIDDAMDKSKGRVIRSTKSLT